MRVESQALPLLILALYHRLETYLCLAQSHSASLVGVCVQVQAVVPLLLDSWQQGLPALLGMYGSVWVVLGSQGSQPSAVYSGRSRFSGCVATICLRGERYWERRAHPEVVQTGNS